MGQEQRSISIEPHENHIERAGGTIAQPGEEQSHGRFRAQQLLGIPTRLVILFAILVVLFFVSFLLGRYPITPGLVVNILASKFLPIPQTWSDTMATVVLQVRFPRIIAAIMVGASLSMSGSAYQSLFKNPLVSPAILGVSAGSAFGAALSILLGLPWVAVQVMSFGFGLVAVASAFLIARMFGSGSMIVLVLGGVVISALFQTLISITQYFADPLNTLPAITFWLMGGLGKVTNHDLLFALIPITLCSLVLYGFRWQINVLSISDEEAMALGINTTRTRLIVVLCATLMTASAVSISGIIGWVGLIVPHMARMVVGPNFPVLLPTSLLMGSAYMLLVDNVARSATSAEIPLGILTAIIGAPVFILLLSKVRQQWA